jgi:hypothetical protein
VPYKDLILEVLNRLLLSTMKPVEAVVRLFHTPTPPDDSFLPPAAMRRVFYNARELAYVLGDREIKRMHLAAAIELDGFLMQERYWCVMQMSADAEAAYNAAIAAAGGINKVTLQGLRTALAAAQ